MSVQSVKKKMDFDKLVKERLVAANAPKPAEEKPVDPKLIKRREYAAKWRANNRSKVNEYSLQWRLKNPEKRKEVERKADAKRKNDPKRIKWLSEYEEKRKNEEKEDDHKPCPDQERKENSSRSQHADGKGRV